MSFNTFGKAGKFLELNFGPGIFWGFSWEVQGYYCVLVFALIRSSLSLEILSSPPPPPPLSRHAVGQKRKHFLPLGAEIFVRTQCTTSANFFFFVVLSTSMATLPTSSSFFSKFVFSGQLK